MNTNRWHHTKRYTLAVFLMVGYWILGGWMNPSWALSLGEYVQPNQGTARLSQDGKTYRTIQEKSDTETVTALINKDNRVYSLQISSKEESLPDPAEYLGEYAGFTQETVQVIPLRGRVVRYTQGGRTAQWSVFGMSGRFSAQAVSLDLAPPQVTDAYKNYVSPQ